MYRDNTLIPSEAVRLLALGILATRECPYAELAHEVRHFVGHVVGPSLDLVGAPIEVLKIEGLICAEDVCRACPDTTEHAMTSGYWVTSAAKASKRSGVCRSVVWPIPPPPKKPPPPRHPAT